MYKFSDECPPGVHCRQVSGSVGSASWLIELAKVVLQQSPPSHTHRSKVKGIGQASVKICVGCKNGLMQYMWELKNS